MLLYCGNGNRLISPHHFYAFPLRRYCESSSGYNRRQVYEAVKEISRLSFIRSTGPGGQNVNKRETCVQLFLDLNELKKTIDEDLYTAFHQRTEKLHIAQGIMLYSQQYRTQEKNRFDCFKKLKVLINESIQMANGEETTSDKKERKLRTAKQKKKKKSQQKHQAHREHIERIIQEKKNQTEPENPR
eukprot:TRINITY_DN4423_c0_g1_i1.p1 TRINITY_DN4423_c0_g1~~TRINITY_DN4423_c0_g1_i1.p1  ORF type:complete len:187 (+),score=26.57 TRINITY_DN4423_c0_g1_i1:367-927(+)